MSSLPKRKRVVITVSEKLKAVERLDKGESVRLICNELGVGKSTVNDWKRNRKSLEDFCTQIESEKVLSSRFTLKKPSHEVLDDALWLWFMQERRKGTPISGVIIKEKALLLHSKIDSNGNFSASDGWLTRWKKRHGVHFLSVSGEKLSADFTASTEFTQKFELIVKEYDPEQVYNLDETGLNFKQLPQKTLATHKETAASGFKLNKERITVAICSNATGLHKLPLFVVGKSKKPRAFKHLNISSLPVYYKAQKSAWMDSFLFREWFQDQFVPQVKKHLLTKNLPLKALLILDNAPTHPQDLGKEGDFRILFLPPNVTSVIQPMDQGVIECLKRRYRRKLLSEILIKTEEEDSDLMSALKSINLKDVIYMLACAYDEIPATTFLKSWRKLWPSLENTIVKNADLLESDGNVSCDDNLNIFRIDLQKLQTGGDKLEETEVREWLQSDSILENEMLTDEEIINCVTEGENDESEEEEEGGDEEITISHAEGKNALQLATRYIEQQEESTAVDVMFLKKWRDFALKKMIDNTKQMRITDYFT